MSRAALERLADGLWLGAGALSLTLGARAGYVATTTPGASSAEPPAVTASPAARQLPGPTRAAPTRGRPERAAPGALVTTQIIVDGAGLGRATVRVDGAEVGQTPYIGDVTCRVGEPVRVELLSSRDEGRSYAVPCRDDVLRLSVGQAR